MRARLRVLRLRLCAALLALLVAGSATASAAAAPATGTIVAELAARRSPEHRYALYLPEAWSAERKWPLLVVLDPRGRAQTAAEIFRAGAERYGYVLMSSYDSRSDQADGQDPNGPALEALITEAQRYSVDLARIYLTGFSGTSKFSWVAGQKMRGVVAGIIGCGGALPPGPWEQYRDVSFVYFGVAGIDDFNHRTMRELDAQLDETGVAHRFEYFAGRHQWLDPELAAAALGWMELQAMKSGRRERDVVVVERLWDRELTEARALEDNGELYDAWRRFAALAADFEDLRPVTVAAAAAARLAATDEVAAAAAELQAALESERRYRDLLGSTMRHILYHQSPRELEELVAELSIAELRAGSEGTSFSAQAARRKLELTYVQAAFYTPRVLFASGAPRRAALALAIAAEIRPEAAGIWYQLARAQALSGEPRQALRSLEQAIDNGFADGDRLRSDPDLQSLRDTRGYKRLVGQVTD